MRDSRCAQNKSEVRRRRLCRNCKSKFVTVEQQEIRDLLVVKKKGGKKLFERKKIIDSITIATRKRNIDQAEIGNIADRIVAMIARSTASEISTKKIGEYIMQELAKIDEVAYIRFASVYGDFNSALDFAKFLRTHFSYC